MGNQDLEWGTEQQQAFDALKEKLCSEPVIAFQQMTVLPALKQTVHSLPWVVYCLSTLTGSGIPLPTDLSP